MTSSTPDSCFVVFCKVKLNKDPPSNRSGPFEMDYRNVVVKNVLKEYPYQEMKKAIYQMLKDYYDCFPKGVIILRPIYINDDKEDKHKLEKFTIIRRNIKESSISSTSAINFVKNISSTLRIRELRRSKGTANKVAQILTHNASYDGVEAECINNQTLDWNVMKGVLYNLNYFGSSERKKGQARLKLIPKGQVLLKLLDKENPTKHQYIVVYFGETLSYASIPKSTFQNFFLGKVGSGQGALPMPKIQRPLVMPNIQRPLVMPNIQRPLVMPQITIETVEQKKSTTKKRRKAKKKYGYGRRPNRA